MNRFRNPMVALILAIILALPAVTPALDAGSAMVKKVAVDTLPELSLSELTEITKSKTASPEEKEKAHLQLGQIQYLSGNYGKAYVHFNQYLQGGKVENFKVYYWAALSLWLSQPGQPKAQEKSMDLVVQGLSLLEPENPLFSELLMLRAHFYYDMDDYNRAESQYLSAMQYSSPQSAAPLKDLCVLLYKKLDAKNVARRCGPVAKNSEPPSLEKEKPASVNKKNGSNTPEKPYTIQTGAFSSLSNAEKNSAKIKDLIQVDVPIFIEQKARGSDSVFVVWVGSFGNEKQALDFQKKHFKSKQIQSRVVKTEE